MYLGGNQEFCFRTLDLWKAERQWAANINTFPSGEAPKYGASRLTKRVDFRTCTGKWMGNMYFCYCSRATGSYFIPRLVYHNVKGLGSNRLSMKHSWCLFLALIKPKFEPVNLNFCSFFHSTQLDCLCVCTFSLPSNRIVFSSNRQLWSSILRDAKLS